MLDNIKQYYEREYKETKELLEREDRPWWATPEEVIQNAIQRCLGVVMFVQELGIKYKDLDIYDEYREKFEKLLKDTLDKDKDK